MFPIIKNIFAQFSRTSKSEKVGRTVGDGEIKPLDVTLLLFVFPSQIWNKTIHALIVKDRLVVNQPWKCRRLLNNMILNESTTLWLARTLESSESPLFYPAHYLFDTRVIESHAHASHVTLPLGGTVPVVWWVPLLMLIWMTSSHIIYALIMQIKVWNRKLYTFGKTCNFYFYM